MAHNGGSRDSDFVKSCQNICYYYDFHDVPLLLFCRIKKCLHLGLCHGLCMYDVVISVIMSTLNVI